MTMLHGRVAEAVHAWQTVGRCGSSKCGKAATKPTCRDLCDGTLLKVVFALVWECCLLDSAFLQNI